MKTIALTKGYFTLVDDADYDWLNQHKWRASVRYYDHGRRILVYAVRWETHGGRGAKILYMHREILGLKERKTQADHRDRNGLNNQRENLRIATHSQNQRNATRHTNTGMRGVSTHPDSSRFRARICVDGKEVHLGMFDTVEQAAVAYDEAVVKAAGEFAVVNFKGRVS